MLIFTPLRLLPKTPCRRGDLVTVTFSVRNIGESEINDARLLVLVEDGLTFLRKQSRIPFKGVRLVGKSSATTPTRGSLLPVVDAGEEIPFLLTFRVDNDQVLLSLKAQLSVPNFELTVTDTLAIPVKRSADVTVSLSGKRNKTRVILTATIDNEGSASDDLVVLIPVPPVLDFLFLKQSNGSYEYHSENGTLRVRLTATAHQKERVTIAFEPNEKMYSDRVEIVGTIVRSNTMGEYPLDSVSIVLAQETKIVSTCHIEDGKDVQAGEIFDLGIILENQGRSLSKNLLVEYPISISRGHSQDILALSGTARVDGVPIKQKVQNGKITLVVPGLQPRSKRLVTLKARVITPAVDGTPFVFRAKVAGQVATPCEGMIRSKAIFPNSQNYVWMTGPRTLRPDASATLEIRLRNAGTAQASNVRLNVNGNGLIIAQATEKGKELSVSPLGNGNGVLIDLGSIRAEKSRIIRVKVLAPETFEDKTSFSALVNLQYDKHEQDLGGVIFAGISSPAIGIDSKLSLNHTEPLHKGEERTVSLRVSNSGSDVAKDVRVDLRLPKSLEIVKIIGSDSQEGILCLGEIAAKASGEVGVVVRLLEAESDDHNLDLQPLIFGDRLRSTELSSIKIATRSRGFIDMTSVCLETHGDSIIATLRMRNVGDGRASNVSLFSKKIDGYLPRSTTFNGQVLRDIHGRSPLACSEGLCVALETGETGIVTWRMAVDRASANARVRIAHEGQSTFEVTALREMIDIHIPFAPKYEDSSEARILLSDGTFAFSEARVSSETFEQINETNELQHRLEARDLDEGEQHEIENEPEEIKIEGDEHKTEDHTDEALKPLATIEPQSPIEQAIAAAENDLFGEEEFSIEKFAMLESLESVDEDDALGEIFDEREIEEETTGASVLPSSSVDEPTEVVTKEFHDNGEKLEPNIDSFSHVDSSKAELPLTPSTVAEGVYEASSNEKDHLLSFERPVGLAVFNTRRIERAQKTISRLFEISKIGWFRHIFAMRLLLPDQIIGISGEGVDAWEQQLRESVAGAFMGPYFATVAANFEPNILWMRGLIDPISEHAGGIILRTIPAAINAQTRYQTEPWQDDEYHTVIPREVYDYIGESERVSLGELNAILATLVVDEGSNQLLSNALKDYKQKLMRTFELFALTGEEEQLRQMSVGPNEELDTALVQIVSTLS